MMLSSTMRTLMGGTEPLSMPAGSEGWPGAMRGPLEEDEEFLLRFLPSLPMRGDVTRSSGGVETFVLRPGMEAGGSSDAGGDGIGGGMGIWASTLLRPEAESIRR